MLADAILFRGRPCQVNEELKLLSCEGRTRAWACTLFALLERLPCAGGKRKVCANAWLIGGLNCRGAGVRILGADVGILNADSNFLSAAANFLFAIRRFLNAA